jgi:predicted MFS family arabinose efflux permease
MGVALTPFFVSSQGVVVANWFGGRRGLATGIMATGVGLGTLVLAPFTQWVVGAAGWAGAFAALAGLFLLVVAPLNALLQRRQPEDAGRVADGGRGGPPAPAGPTVRDALRQGRFWALMGGFLLGVIPFQLLLIHGVAHLVDVGFTRETAAATLGLSGAGAIGGMLLWGAVADRWGAEWAATGGAIALIAATALLFVLTPDRAPLLPLYAVLFALGMAARVGGVNPFMGAALCKGPSFGTLMGLLSAQVALGSAIGPALGGWVFDTTGSYDLALLLGIGCSAGAAVCVWLAAPRRGLLQKSGRHRVADGSPAPEGAV